MNAGKAVYGILNANSGVTDLVGTRIFPEIAEQEAATPFIVYQLLSVDPEDTHDGPSKLDEVRFEFLCYADTYDTAADVGVKVRAALDRVSGTYNGDTAKCSSSLSASSAMTLLLHKARQSRVRSLDNLLTLTLTAYRTVN